MHGWGTRRSRQVLPRTSALHTQISMQRAQSCRSCSRSRGRPSGALQVDHYSTGDTNNVCRRRTKVVVPRSRSRPHFVVLQQVRINEHAQLCAVTKGRHATIGFGNLLLQAEPWLARQVGFNERLVLGVSDRDIARNRQVVSGLLRISQGSK